MHKQQKKKVSEYWNRASCGTEYTQQKKFSAAYFAEIEALRYRIEPEIFSFAQFTRYRHKRVLEVGVGAGTDFVQWVRAGSYAYGIDLTQEAIENTQRRLSLEQLEAHYLSVADAEQLPFETNFFDLVYSWGVIHHSPDPFVCLSQMIRVTKPGGTLKIMVYNRHSLFAFYQYLIHGVKKGRFFARWKDIIFQHQESFGTQAYTQTEMRKKLAEYPVDIVQLTAPLTQHDLLYYKSWPFRFLAVFIGFLVGRNNAGWFMRIELKKHVS